ncbi:acetyl-CoA carboxylase biotin carboxylase subunit [Microbulbifer sp. SAOS-129_SWC]|uniref:acetyl/propionyl/methylcrotonyl-CoA carboxylase subunit alpha n=1 Tax=Microbulbifer sp. SAOS-129_SWC TaxID=3145235 RepID=UPI003217FBE2
MSETTASGERPALLIANRGEIAVRIAHSARAEGYRTIAIHSDADRDALHVQVADSAVAIGGNTPAESYLDIGKVIAAAHRSGATAVHPGYGFLAENADFARACSDAGLQFVGPAAEAIELMGNKRRAKDFVAAAGVPCIPGFQGSQDDDVLIEAAQQIGFPLMIKAAAGGGGRGMRLAHDSNELPAQLRSARSEAQSAFGSGELILEKALIDARHIEIQVFADNLGNAIHLGERDCSIQRRHQKIVEESPSPAVDPALRERMGAAAVAAARACDYSGAGTVEFLLDGNGDFYFLEMNTRLQVEHPVTEMVTGLDLVAWQLAVARGEPLPITQEQVQQRGHAIEVRLYAEDPEQHFLPQTGEILHWRAPQGDGIRIDHGIRAGCAVSPYYDPMLGKLIAWGDNREQARRRLCAALEQLELIGPKNNLPFLHQILEHPLFCSGGATTAFIEQVFPDLNRDNSAAPADAETLATAAALLHEAGLSAADRRSGRANWRSDDHRLPFNYRLQNGDETYECLLHCGGAHSYRIAVNEAAIDVEIIDSEAALLRIDGAQQRQLYRLHNGTLHLPRNGYQWQFRNATQAPANRGSSAGNGRITAPMDGCIVEVLVQPQQAVKHGETLAVMEAMKMEHPLKADRDGTIATIAAGTGDQVRGGQLLVQIEAD